MAYTYTALKSMVLSFAYKFGVPSLAVVGAIVLLRAVYHVFAWLWLYFGPSSNLSKYGAKRGSDSSKKTWALVTGASDGIGYFS